LSQTLTHAYRDIHCKNDIGAALGPDDGADESTSPQAGISQLSVPDQFAAERSEIVAAIRKLINR
jgi:hypothetical protein